MLTYNIPSMSFPTSTPHSCRVSHQCSSLGLILTAYLNQMKVSVMQTGAGKQGAPRGCVLGFSTWTLLCSVLPRFVRGVEFFFWNNWVVSGAHLRLSWNAKGNRSEYSRELGEDNLLPEQRSATSTPSPAFHLLKRADKRHTSCLPLYINSKNTMRGKHPPEPEADTPKQGLAHTYSIRHMLRYKVKPATSSCVDWCDENTQTRPV